MLRHQNQPLVSSSPRLLIIWSSYELGGAERQLIYLARDWRQHGYQVEFLGIFDGKLRPQLENEGFVCHLLENMWQPTLIWRIFRKLRLLEHYYLILMRRRLQQLQPDLVITAINFINVIVGNVWPQIKSIRGQLWNQVDVGLGRMNINLERQAITNASFLISNSQVSADFLRGEFGNISGVSDKIKIIPNIIPATFSSPRHQAPHSSSLNPKSTSTRYRHHPDEIIITMVATLSHFKDHPTLLNAWSDIIKSKLVSLSMPSSRIKSSQSSSSPSSSPQLRLLLAGRDDGTRSTLEKQITHLGLNSSVEFLGEITDVPQLLAQSDIFVLASRSEGSSNSLAEAMLAGLPVVVADIPANIELLGPNYPYYYHYGASAPSSDLSAQLLTLINSSQLRSQVGAHLQKQACQYFDSPAHLTTYRQLIINLLNSSS